MLACMTAAGVKWSERIGEWQQSGQSVAEFARARGFSESTLKWWIAKLKREGTADVSVRIARVKRAKSSAEPTTLTVAVGTATIHVRSGFDSALLREIVTALGAAR